MAVQQGKPDVLVVGGGPIGLASAWRAAQRGLEEGARAGVADEVQAGGGDALARGHDAQ